MQLLLQPRCCTTKKKKIYNFLINCEDLWRLKDLKFRWSPKKKELERISQGFNNLLQNLRQFIFSQTFLLFVDSGIFSSSWNGESFSMSFFFWSSSRFLWVISRYVRVHLFHSSRAWTYTSRLDFEKIFLLFKAKLNWYSGIWHVCKTLERWKMSLEDISLVCTRNVKKND